MGVVFVGDIKQEIIELVNKVDDPKALRIIYYFIRGLSENLKYEASQGPLLKE